MPYQIENHMVIDAVWEPWHHRVVCRCCDCEGNIYEGEDYYSIEGTVVCENCIRDYVKVNYKRKAKVYWELEYGIEEE